MRLGCADRQRDEKLEGYSVKAVYQIEGSENPDDDTLKEMVMEGARKVLVGFF